MDLEKKLLDEIKGTYEYRVGYREGLAEAKCTVEDCEQMRFEGYKQGYADAIDKVEQLLCEQEEKLFGHDHDDLIRRQGYWKAFDLIEEQKNEDK